jgi:RNA polymerase sigma factor (sigma-70 family)
VIRTDSPHPTPKIPDREATFAAALPWVRREADRVAAKFADSPEFDADDLFQVGALAAWALAGKWDRSVSKFYTFACLRVHGAMIDFIRGGVSVGRVRKAGRAAGRLTSAKLPEVYAPPEAECGDADDAEFGSLLRRVRPEASERERAMMVRYFAGGETMREVGQGEGLSESRVCQVIGRVVAGIRERCESRGLTRRTAFA